MRVLRGVQKPVRAPNGGIRCYGRTDSHAQAPVQGNAHKRRKFVENGYVSPRLHYLLHLFRNSLSNLPSGTHGGVDRAVELVITGGVKAVAQLALSGVSVWETCSWLGKA